MFRSLLVFWVIVADPFLVTLISASLWELFVSSSRKSALGVLHLLSLFLSDRRTDDSLLTSSSAVRLGRPSGTSPLEPGPDRKKQTLANVSSAH